MVKVALGLIVVAAVAVAIAAFGTGGSEGSESSSVEQLGVGQYRAGSVAQLAQCEDWAAGTDEQKQVTLDDIQNQLNQAGADGPTPDLSDDKAIEILDRACSQSYATGIRLYKLYARAAAFAPFAVGIPAGDSE
jgi:hypothetical protein